MLSLKSNLYWKSQYTEQNIKIWFNNFLTYYTVKPSLDIAKKEFLSSELDFINTVFYKKDQEKMYNLVKSVIDNI